ncbi:MAG: M91 family zinc metallopeptidase [Candidatus Spechtbacterales bacterium]|nr:M91 family zinc metallopeptidase [Candidatus Spechtbacterales bacterium]
MAISIFIASFLIFTPSADASIVIEGSLEFTDEVNDCLNTYRDAPGVVGDAIKELENSENEHKIINSPDWNNTSNNLEEATGGSGSGTVTRVDSEKLQEYVERIESLKDKDFCTALLHELYHALDADRGTRTAHSHTIDDVKRNEVEATLFQNFVHAIRGVPPRTTYGGEDISEHVVIGGNETEEAEEESPGEEDEEQPENTENETETSVSLDFKHVKPSEYSEVYATVKTYPGATVDIVLDGPGVDSQLEQSETADSDGLVSFTWRIVSFGTYTASGTAAGDSFSSSIDVY